MKRHASLILLVCGLALLSGCASDEENDLRSWMTQQRATIKPRITPIEEPKQFTPAAYDMDSGLNPFEAMRLTQGARARGPSITRMISAKLMTSAGLASA